MHFNNSYIDYFKSPEVAKRLFFAATLFKIIGYLIFVYSGAQFWTPVTDANLYDAIARGAVVRDNPWGGLLKTLNDHGFYSRLYISAFIFALNCVVVPWLVFKVCVPSGRAMLAIDWYLLLAVALYPTMTIYSVDIFRDTVMVVLFLCFTLGVKYFLTRAPSDWKTNHSASALLVMLICGYLLYTLRFYLAAALIASVAAAFFFDLSKKWWLLAGLYFVVLLVINWFGFFDWLKGGYRETYAGAGSGYGIDFSQGIFLIKFIQSFLYSVYGFFIYSHLSFVVFLVESLPILLLTAYIYVSRQYCGKLINFFLFFFFIYAALWTIGVDSLGTAVRYRLFNYVVILLAASLLQQEKQKSKCVMS